MNTIPSWPKFGIAVAVQVLLLGGLIFMHQIVIISGQTVTLKVEPVDPRSPLRGDFVRLRYNISSIDSELVVDNLEESDTAYVVLEPQTSQDYWEPVQVYSEWPDDVTQNQVVIRGPVENAPRESGRRRINANTISINNEQDLRMEYGIEEYFIPEGTGRDVNFAGKKVRAKVKVGSRGRAVLQNVLIDGEPWP